jgi:cystathionine gamma-synthase
MKLETLAVHAGYAPDPTTGAVTPPIYLTTTFLRETDGSFPHGYIYARSGNPNRQALEERLRILEGGAVAIAFSSGMAAIMSTFQALSPGDHIIVPDDAYYGTAQLLKIHFIPWGLQVSFVDMTDLSKIQEALHSDTKLIWAETPSNPLLKISDIQRISDLAHQVGAIVVVDGTWATPVIQRPLDLGANLVMHSSTKYFGGHCDLMGGVLIAREETPFVKRIRSLQINGGAIPSPFDCWLILRGLQTLPYRMRAHSENAEKIAHFLNTHSAVEQVHYPGLISHPGHAIAARQMTTFGGMMSVQVRGGAKEAMEVAAKVKIFTRATSLGGTESLIEHRASIEGPQTRAPQNLLRLSIGLEHPDDLIEDLDQAMLLR